MTLTNEQPELQWKNTSTWKREIHALSLVTGAYRSMCNLAAQISGCMGGHWGQDLDTFTPPFTSNKVRNVDVLWTYDRYIAPPPLYEAVGTGWASKNCKYNSSNVIRP